MTHQADVFGEEEGGSLVDVSISNSILASAVNNKRRQEHSGERFLHARADLARRGWEDQPFASYRYDIGSHGRPRDFSAAPGSPGDSLARCRRRQGKCFPEQDQCEVRQERSGHQTNRTKCWDSSPQGEGRLALQKVSSPRRTTAREVHSTCCVSLQSRETRQSDGMSEEKDSVEM